MTQKTKKFTKLLDKEKTTSNKDDILNEFKKTMDGYKKYQMTWLADHGYGIYDIVDTFPDFIKVRKSSTYTFSDYIVDTFKDNGEKMFDYQEWLQDNCKGVLEELSDRVSKQDVYDAMEDSVDLGYILKKDVDNIRKEFGE